MKRSIKPRKVGFVPWLVGVLLVGGALVGVFSLGRSAWLAHLPGVRPGSSEWNGYNSIFDRHPSARAEVLPILRFGTSKEITACIDAQAGGAWRTRWFEAPGYGDSIDVRNLHDRAGFQLRFKKDAPYHDQWRISLSPASAHSERVAQLGAIANELGLVTPATALVRVLSCGSELGVHQQTEWVDDAFVARRGIRGATLVRMGMDPGRPDQQFAQIDADSAERSTLNGVIERALSELQQGNTDPIADLVDEKSALAWLLMAWIDGRDLRAAPVTFTYQWSTARMMPIYEAPIALVAEQQQVPLLNNVLTPLLRRPAFRARFEKQQAELAAQWPAIQQKLAASSGSSQQQWNAGMLNDPRLSASHIGSSHAATWLDRPTVDGPGHATFVHGMALPAVAAVSVEDTLMLAQLMKRYKLTMQGDTIIFPRGKYEINEDLEFPAGKAVLLLQGARLFIAPGRSVSCKGDLYIRGTLRNPVFVRAQNDAAPFGALALVGSGSQQCSISGLYISGGAGAKLAGMPCGGMLTVLGAARTRITASVFQENAAQASLLVDGGELLMSEVRCEDAAKQFIQLEHTRAVLRELTLVGARVNTTNGLLVGTGTVALLGGAATNLNGTAIKATDAAQVLVRRARFAQNATAIHSEARAEVHVEGNTLDGNEVAFSTAGATPGDRIVLYANTLTGNTTDRAPQAAVRERAALEQNTVAVFGVLLNEPPAPVSGAGRKRPTRR